MVGPTTGLRKLNLPMIEIKNDYQCVGPSHHFLLQRDDNKNPARSPNILSVYKSIFKIPKSSRLWINACASSLEKLSYIEKDKTRTPKKKSKIDYPFG